MKLDFVRAGKNKLLWDYYMVARVEKCIYFPLPQLCVASTFIKMCGSQLLMKCYLCAGVSNFLVTDHFACFITLV